MELYYKDLISKDASLENLVDNLMLAVQGADELVAAAGSSLDPQRKEEIMSRLERLKSSCRAMRDQALATARATDKMLREFPLSSFGLAFALGVLAGTLLTRRAGSKQNQ